MFSQSATKFISPIQMVSLQHGHSWLSKADHHFSQWVELACGVSVVAPMTKLRGVSPQVWWADKRKCPDCSPTVLQRLILFHPTVSVVLCCALALNHQLSLLRMTLAGQFLALLLLEPKSLEFTRGLPIILLFLDILSMLQLLLVTFHGLRALQSSTARQLCAIISLVQNLSW